MFLQNKREEENKIKQVLQMNKFILIVFVGSILLLTGCEDIDLSKLSDEDLERISDKFIVCPEDYMRFGSSCCLDKDSNRICDRDERELSEEEEKEEEVVSEPVEVEPAVSEPIKEEPKLYSPLEVWQKRKSLVNHEIKIKGELRAVYLACTDEACTHDNPCCSSCSGNLGFQIYEGTALTIKGKFNRKTIGCSSDGCKIKCYPMKNRETYQSTFILRTDGYGEYYLEFSKGALIEGEPTEEEPVEEEGISYIIDIVLEEELHEEEPVKIVEGPEAVSETMPVEGQLYEEEPVRVE